MSSAPVADPAPVTEPAPVEPVVPVEPPQATETAPVVTDAPVDSSGTSAPTEQTPPAQPAVEEAVTQQVSEVEEADPEPPYLRWYVSDAADPTSTPLETATKFAVQGPRNAAAASDADEPTLWLGSLTATIEDNVGQEGYAGLDLDKRPGWFTVKQLVDDVTPTSTHDVLENENYRIRPVEGPAGYLFGEDAAWADFAVLATNDEAQVKPYALATSAPVADEDTAQKSELLEDDGVLTPFLIGGPEPELVPPYVYWDVKVGGVPVGGATFTIQGPHNTTQNDNNSSWGTSYTVTDNVGQPGYSGLDKDPDPGEFAITHIGNSGQTQLQSNRRYRVAQTTAAPGYTFTDTAARAIARNTGTNNWQLPSPNPWTGQVYNFGTWTNTVLGNCASDCSNLTIINTVVGGSATAADWSLTATRNNATSDTYPFTSGQLRAVPRNSTYTLAATADPAVQAGYATSVSCSTSGGSGINVSVNNPPYTVQFPNNNGRAAICTFTHTYISHTIVMHKGDLRTGLGSGGINVSSTHVVGARFGLYESQGAATTIAECTIAVAADGCRFENVTQTGVQLWVGELTPVPGSPAALNYSAPLGTLTTGTTGSFTDRPYRYATPTLSSSSSQTYNLPQSSGSNTGGDWAASSQRYANRLNNPQLTLDCMAGVDVALVMDLSGSVANAGAAGTLRDAAKGFVDALGTNSSVALFSFGNTSPRENTANQPTPLNTGTQRTQIDAIIDNYYTWTVTNQGTNWDAGLYEASLGAAAHQYDMVIVLTDGNPTFSGTTPDGSGSLTTFRELERSIFSANNIKAAGSRVVTVGIGAGLSNFNLAAVSGPQGYAAGMTLNQVDYVNTNWSALKALLEDFAKGLSCEAEITVKKMAAEPGQPLTAKPGWEFTATGGAPGTLTPTGTQVTNASGEFTWNLKFTQPNHTGDVTITEALPAGWTQTGLTCTVNNAALPVELDPSVTITGIGIGDDVYCTFTNVKQQDPATVQVDKKWIITDATGATTLETYTLPGDEGELPAWLTASPTITGVGEAPTITDPVWGTAYSGFKKDQQVKIGETAALTEAAPKGCAIHSQELTRANGAVVTPPANVAGANTYTATLVTGANSYEITNTVRCDTKLTLVKSVTDTTTASSDATPADWRLSATAPEQSTLDGNGTVTGSVAPGVGYDLAETLAVDASTDSQLYTPKAGGAWSCTIDGQPLSGDFWNISGEVAVQLGQHVTCTVTNVTAELTLLKWVEGSPAVDPDNWVLRATAESGALPARPDITGSWVGDGSASGSGQATASNTVIVKPGEAYSLAEAFADPDSNLAYLFDRVEQWNGTAWVTADPENVVVAAGQQGIYRFVNKPAPSIAVPLTGGMSADSFGVVGSALAILAALMGAAAYMRRTRRQTEVQ